MDFDVREQHDCFFIAEEALLRVMNYEGFWPEVLTP